MCALAGDLEELHLRNWKQIKPFVLLTALPLLATVALAQPQQHTFTVPFHTANNLILLDAQLNGKPAVFLLDTGSNVSFVDMHSAPLRFKADRVRRVGMAGCIVVHSRITLGGLDIPDQKLCVADLSDVARDANEHVDGFVGEDVLQEFSAVRIDYKRHVVELELGE